VSQGAVEPAPAMVQFEPLLQRFQVACASLCPFPSSQCSSQSRPTLPVAGLPSAVTLTVSRQEVIVAVVGMSSSLKASRVRTLSVPEGTPTMRSGCVPKFVVGAELRMYVSTLALFAGPLTPA
jgi:hypothetical protein